MRCRPLPFALACVVLAAASARAGVRVVPEPVRGGPGERVVVTVRLLIDGDETVVGLQNDIVFDPHTPIGADAEAQPLCTVAAEIDKSATAFAFLPPGCAAAPGSCAAARAVVLAFDNTEPIDSGAVLYRCEVAIAPEAPAAAYPLAVLPGTYASPGGGDRPAAGGSTVVELRPETPGATPSPPAGTATVRMATPTPTAERPETPADVNCDREVNGADLDTAAVSLFGGRRGCDGDCNGDGRIGAADVVCVAASVATDAIKRRAAASLRFEDDQPASFQPPGPRSR